MFCAHTRVESVIYIVLQINYLHLYDVTLALPIGKRFPWQADCGRYQRELFLNIGIDRDIRVHQAY